MLEPHTRRLLDEGAVYREHKLDTWQLERNYTLAVESRHGIIGESPTGQLEVQSTNLHPLRSLATLFPSEYEGSPRRIGVAASSNSSNSPGVVGLVADENEPPTVGGATAPVAAAAAAAVAMPSQQQLPPMATVPPMSSTLQKTAARAALAALAQCQPPQQQQPQPQSYPVRPGFPQVLQYRNLNIVR